LRERPLLEKIRQMRLEMEGMKSRINVLESENECLKRGENNQAADMQHRATAKLVKRLQLEIK